MRKIIIAIFCMCFLTACGDDTSFGLASPSIRFISGEGAYEYIIDENTNNVYLKYNHGRQAGMSIIMNPDGTPMTLEQLKEKLK